jgi:hypothetical protein
MVRCKPLKEALAAAASQLADGLLEHVRASLKASSMDIGDSCAAMAAEVREAWCRPRHCLSGTFPQWQLQQAHLSQGLAHGRS